MTTEDVISDQKSAEDNTALNIEGGNVSENCPPKESSKVDIPQETTTSLEITDEMGETKVTEKSFPWGKVLLFPFKLCWKIIVYTSIAVWLIVKYTSIVAVTIIFFALGVIFWFVRFFIFLCHLCDWLLYDKTAFPRVAAAWRSLWGAYPEDDE